jgi:hypothetical protein
MAVAPARLRMPLIHLGLAAIAVDSFLLELPRWPLLGLLAVAFAIYLRVGTVPPPGGGGHAGLGPPGGLEQPGRPGAKPPPARLRVDLRHRPGPRPGRRAAPRARLVAHGPASRGLPGFGQPVLAPADATVVRAHDRERDHWSRTSPPAMLYLVLEGTVRELLGPGRILGNHVVLDLGGGVYATLAPAAVDGQGTA